MAKDWRRLAKAITRIENLDFAALTAAASLPLDDGAVQIIGVTGPPGGGKSTLVNRLIEELAKERRVAALLIDPSSPYSGGAILGDRIRMQAHACNPNVFIRSLSNRGNPGGVNSTIIGILRVVMDWGFDYIVIETVGAGQSEVKIASIADTTLVVSVPNLGDDIQATKSGILEVADILVINKADLPGTDALYTALRDSAQKEAAGWEAPLCQTIAAEGEGIKALIEEIQRHRQWLSSSGRLLEKRKKAAKFEIMELSQTLLKKHLDSMPAAVLASKLSRQDINLLQMLDEIYGEIFKKLGEV